MKGKEKYKEITMDVRAGIFYRKDFYIPLQ